MTDNLKRYLPYTYKGFFGSISARVFQMPSGYLCMYKDAVARIEQLKQERDEARVMVLRLVVARYRQGWEQGDSEEEVHDLALSKLGGWELDPCNNRSECEKILGFKIEDPE